MGEPASRVGDHAQNDSHSSTGIADKGSPDTLINGHEALRKCDKGPWVSGACQGEQWQAIMGSPTVLVNGRALMRKTDPTKHGNCGPGKMIEGSPDVIVGGQSPTVDALAAYIQGEMARNIKDPRLLQIQQGFKMMQDPNVASSTAPMGIWLAQLQQWAALVGTNRPWDHKRPIRNAFGESAYDPATGKALDFTIWSNLHYGFVGRAAGFDESTLLDGAGLANKAAHENFFSGLYDKARFFMGAGSDLRNADQPADQVAIKSGFDLWNDYQKTGKLPTADDIKNKVLSTPGMEPGADKCCTS
jgi:uncharacterized Zn-binding protein involved in type VI secretion